LNGNLSGISFTAPSSPEDTAPYTVQLALPLSSISGTLPWRLVFGIPELGPGGPWDEAPNFTYMTYPVASPAAPVVSLQSPDSDGDFSSGATLHANLDDPGSAANVGLAFEYWPLSDTNNKTTAAGTPVSRGTAGDFSAVLTGLAPNTGYGFRGVGYGDGTGYTADGSFTTSADVFSPGQIAFVSDRDAGTLAYGQIYSMAANGSSQTNISNRARVEKSGDFSPDGSRIVFTSDSSGDYAIYTMNSDGSGLPTLVVDGLGVKVLPLDAKPDDPANGKYCMS
jgi:hypothetical protein